MAERKYSDYHNFLAGLEQCRPDNTSGFSTSLYLEDLNLLSELSSVPQGGIVVDVGCCGGGGTEGLAAEFDTLSFFGITPTLIQLRGRSKELQVPIIPGVAEELSSVLGEYGITPNVILMRNVMEQACLGEDTCGAVGLVTDVFRELNLSLDLGGRALIYDQYGQGKNGIPFYERYKKLGLVSGFFVEEVSCLPRTRFRNRQCPTYLRLEKQKSLN